VTFAHVGHAFREIRRKASYVVTAPLMGHGFSVILDATTLVKVPDIEKIGPFRYL
jgi:hypothetical protein